MFSYSDAFIDAARSALGLGDELQIMTVLPGSGAEQAGLRKGDALLAVEIEPVPAGPNAESAAAELIGSEMRSRTSLHLVIRRDGQRIAVDVPLTPACAMAIDLGNTAEPIALADGHRVMVTRGMLDFVQSDEELAYVLAREIARNETMTTYRAETRDLIDHLHAIDAGATSGGFPADVLDAARSYASDVDADTAKLALYMLARAGFGIEGFQAFWQHLAMGATDGGSGGRGDTVPAQPPVALRLSALEQAIRDVESKMASGLPLVP